MYQYWYFSYRKIYYYLDFMFYLDFKIKNKKTIFNLFKVYFLCVFIFLH